MSHDTNLGRATPGTRPRIFEALNDIVGGALQFSVWQLLATSDVRARYRRSRVGQLWHTLMAAVLIGTIAFVMSNLQRQPLTDHLPYVAVSYTFWLFFQASVIEACTVFVHAKGFVTNMPMPWSTFKYALIYRNALFLLHNYLLIVLVFLVIGVAPTWTLFAVPLVFALIVINLGWIALLVAILATRYRDLQHVIQSALLISFFFTPIMFRPIGLGSTFEQIVMFNPLSTLIRAYTDPFFGRWPGMLDLLALVGVAAIGWGVTLIVFARVRSRIIFWL